MRRGVPQKGLDEVNEHMPRMIATVSVLASLWGAFR